MMPADRTERKPTAYEQTTVTCAEPCLCSCHKNGADCSRCNIPISEIHKRAGFAGGGKGQGWSAQEREFGKEILRLTAELARLRLCLEPGKASYGQPDDGTSIPYQHEFNTGRKASPSVKAAMVRASLSQGDPEGTPPQANPEISESRIQEGKQDA